MEFVSRFVEFSKKPEASPDHFELRHLCEAGILAPGKPVWSRQRVHPDQPLEIGNTP
jgi:hypothetical protein